MPREVKPAGRERERAEPPAQKKRISTIDVFGQTAMFF